MDKKKQDSFFQEFDNQQSKYLVGGRGIYIRPDQLPVAGIKAKPDNPNGLFGVVLGLTVD